MQNISGWININKPGGITSMKAVAIVKSIMQVKKIGHAGTLDPMADGVLPMAINSATKLIDKCTNSLKQYEFTVQMGSTTDTDDAEGTQTQTTEFIPDKQSIINILPQFTGLITQVPPKFSAIKINGQRAYKLARESLVEFEMKARQITIYDIALIDYCKNSKSAKFTTTCSKGTYIRSLAKDIMSQVGSLGHINQLSRLKVGNFLIKDALNLLDLQKIDFMVARNLLLNRILRVEQI
jgi:tRNA pseudouridine55 synthase